MQFYHQTRTCESLAWMRTERKTVFHVHIQTNTNLKQSEGNGGLKEFTTCCQNWQIHNGNVVRVVLRGVWKEPETINWSLGLIFHQCLYCICQQHLCRLLCRLWHLGTDPNCWSIFPSFASFRSKTPNICIAKSLLMRIRSKPVSALCTISKMTLSSSVRMMWGRKCLYKSSREEITCRASENVGPY